MGYLLEKYKVSSTPYTIYENKLQVKWRVLEENMWDFGSPFKIRHQKQKL